MLEYDVLLTYSDMIYESSVSMLSLGVIIECINTIGAIHVRNSA